MTGSDSHQMELQSLFHVHHLQKRRPSHDYSFFTPPQPHFQHQRHSSAAVPPSYRALVKRLSLRGRHSIIVDTMPAAASHSVAAGGVSKRQRRPPRLELASSTSSAASSASNLSPALPPNSATTGSVYHQSLKTPHELANDIAIQCVSPGIATFMNSELRDVVMISKNIEAQQRKYIAQRNIKESRSPDGKNAAAARSLVTPLSSTDSENRIREQEIEIDQSGSPSSASSSSSLKFPSSASLKSTTKRHAPPAKLRLSAAATAFRRPLIHSAPLDRIAARRLATPITSSSTSTSRVVSNPIPRNGVVPTRIQQGDRITTVFVNKTLDDRGAKTSVPSSNNNQRWLLNTHPHQRSQSFENVQKKQLSEEDDEDDEYDGDPEDAALSEDEKDDPESRALDDVDEDDEALSNRGLKRQRVNGIDVSAPTSTPRRETLAAKVAQVATEAMNVLPSPSSSSSHSTMTAEQKKDRFLKLCSDMWDLIQE